MSTRRRLADLAAKAALAVGVPLVALALVEAVAFLCGVEPRAHEPGFADRRSIEDCRWDPTALEGCDASRFRSHGGRRRVMVYGGSSAFGHPYGETRTLSSYLQQELDALRPRSWFVHRLALPCKDSYYVLHCAERSIAAANALVIYTGHNEFGGYQVRHPRAALFVREHPWLLDVRDALAHTRTYSLLSPPVASSLQDAIDAPDPDWDFEASRRIALDAALRDLTETLDLARSEGVPVILVTVASNLSEFPFPRARWDEVLERVRASASPPRWLQEYARGIELERAGDRARSLAAFRRSRDGVAPALRAPTAFDDALRALARERPEVHLVDFERELDALGLEEGIGCNFFGTEEYCDGVHQNPRTSQLIARSVARELIRIHLPPLEQRGRRGRSRRRRRETLRSELSDRPGARSSPSRRAARRCG
jgi:hypothetical protein